MAKEKKKKETAAEQPPVEEAVSPETQAEPEEAADASEEAPQEPEAAPEKDPCEELAAQLTAEKDKYLRLAAEFDNFRRRSQKEKDALREDIRCSAVAELLPVYDNLERALAAECTDEAFYKGVEMTMTQLKNIFSNMNVSEIPAVGECFDPNLHNAVMHIEDDKYEANIIVQEFQKGFKLGDRVIRHSMVQVAN